MIMVSFRHKHDSVRFWETSWFGLKWLLGPSPSCGSWCSSLQVRSRSVQVGIPDFQSKCVPVCLFRKTWTPAANWCLYGKSLNCIYCIYWGPISTLQQLIQQIREVGLYCMLAKTSIKHKSTDWKWQWQLQSCYSMFHNTNTTYSKNLIARVSDLEFRPDWRLHCTFLCRRSFFNLMAFMCHKVREQSWSCFKKTNVDCWLEKVNKRQSLNVKVACSADPPQPPPYRVCRSITTSPDLLLKSFVTSATDAVVLFGKTVSTLKKANTCISQNVKLVLVHRAWTFSGHVSNLYPRLLSIPPFIQM